MASMAGIVLAGGASRRMGRDKRGLRLWGTAGPTLLAHVVVQIAALCDEVIVVLNDPQDWGDLPGRLVADAYPGFGPLGGLATGLQAMAASHALLVACDMPYVEGRLVQALAAELPGYDAVVPLRAEGARGPRNCLAAEPLLAVYARSCVGQVVACLERGERRMVAPLAELKVCYIEPDRWQAYDPTGRSFLNLNQPEDLAFAQLA